MPLNGLPTLGGEIGTTEAGFNNWHPLKIKSRFPFSGVGSVEQEGSGGNKVLHPTTAKGRDGNGGSYDSEERGTKLGGIQASAGRRELH